MIARNIAPGLGNNRGFAFKQWAWLDEAVWKEETREAYLAIDHDVVLDIRASDVDPIAIEAAKANAEEAGVDECITFTCEDFRSVRYDVDHGVLNCQSAVWRTALGRSVGQTSLQANRA
ncbi:MAG: hypothetical protein MZU97_19800 [Bacillus subtilis]|nr:hypothetical protein [Bacillus subtilis]